jgi:hypothetical protein
MSTVNERGWTWLDEEQAPGPDTARGKAVAARADALMHEWSEMHHEDELTAWRRQDDEYDPGYDPRNCDCGEGADDDPDELCTHDRQALEEFEHAAAVRAEGRRLRMQLIEAELENLGARKMRPYEHWNEDEVYMRWQEEGRFGEWSE